MKRFFKKGFTLVELVVVIAIIAILSGVSVAVYVGISNNAKESKYLQLATQGMKQLLTEYGGSLEENTYFAVKDNGKEVAFFKYNQGKIAKTDSRPTNDIDYAYPINSSNSTLLEEVTAYRPIVKNVVVKLNKQLTEDSATDYITLADAGLKLSNEEFNIINWQEGTYRFNYSLSKNKVFITNATQTELLYSDAEIASIPTDKKILKGANITSKEDFISFSNITNLHEAGIPTAENIFVKNNPVVICNMKTNVSFTSTDVFEPLANWYIYGGNNGSICYSIHLLLNGNNYNVGPLTKDSFIGVLTPGSVVRDISVSYLVGSETNPTGYLTSANDINSKYDGTGYWHTSMFIKAVDCRNSNICTYINNVTLSGKAYFGGVIPGGCHNTFAALVGFYVNKNSDTTMLSINNASIFAGADDILVAKRSGASDCIGKDGIGLITGMFQYGNGTGSSIVPKGLQLNNSVYDNSQFDYFGRRNGGDGFTTTNPLYGNKEGF